MLVVVIPLLLGFLLCLRSHLLTFLLAVFTRSGENQGKSFHRNEVSKNYKHRTHIVCLFSAQLQVHFIASLACYKACTQAAAHCLFQGYADYYLTRPRSSSCVSHTPSQSPPGPPPPPPPSKSPSPLPCVAPHHESSDSLRQSASPPLPPPPNKKCPPPPPPRLTPLLSLTSSPHPSHYLSAQGPPQPPSVSAYPRFVFQHHPPESYQPPVQEGQAKSVKFVSFSQQ